MANRAYLFPSDSGEFERLGHLAGPYFDSRWVIPAGWLFLYGTEDVAAMSVTFEDATWEEVKLRAPKDRAIGRFEARRPVLARLLGGRPGDAAVDEFVATLRGWAGRFLLMDPEEVIAGGSDAERELATRFEVLRLLDAGPVPFDAVAAEVERYVGPLDHDPERCRGQVLGYTYR
jgi:hypothetical protein